jgi:small multidrug resistance pump
MNYLWLAGAILSEVIATTSLKAAEGFTRPFPSAVVVACYAIAFYCLSQTLKTIPLGIAYAIWSGAGTMLIALVGVVLYRQVLEPVMPFALVAAGSQFFRGPGARSDTYRVSASEERRRDRENWPRPFGLRRKWPASFVVVLDCGPATDFGLRRVCGPFALATAAAQKA